MINERLKILVGIAIVLIFLSCLIIVWSMISLTRTRRKWALIIFKITPGYACALVVVLFLIVLLLPVLLPVALTIDGYCDEDAFADNSG